MVGDVNHLLGTLWTNLLRCEVVDKDADFFDCGGTSIAAVHLAALIQETFNVSIDALDVINLRSFGKLSDLITLRLGAASEGMSES